MKTIQPIIHRFKESVHICVLGDLHVGNIGFDEELFDSILDLAQRKNCQLILMGDLAEAITVTDRRFDWASVDRNLINPSEQYDYLLEKFYPFKNKILGVLTGNHDDKIRKNSETGYDYVERELCKKLNAPYLGYKNMMRIKIGSHYKDLYLWHGKGKGFLTGGKINRLQRLAQGFDANIYLMGHTHRLWNGADALVQLKQERNAITTYKKIRHYVLTGGFLQGYRDPTPRDYIAHEAFGPLRLGCTFIRIDDKHIGIQQVGED